MGWISLDKQQDQDAQLRYATAEMYTGVDVLESFRYVFTDREKLQYEIDFDAVSYHAARDQKTNDVMALIMLERIDDNTITYKPYTENECPGAAAYCPKSILDRLTTTDNLYALQWREAAYKSIELNKPGMNNASALNPADYKLAHQKVSAEQADELLRGYSLVATINVHGTNAPDGHTLEETRSIYQKGKEYAIKTELFDVDSYGMPEATYFENKLSAWEVATRQKESLRDSELYINGQHVTDKDQIAKLFNIATTKIEERTRSDPDANPLHSRDGNDFTDALIDHFENNSNKKKSPKQLNNSTMEKKTVTGFVGKSFNYNYNEESKKSVISLQIKPREGDWVHVKAFNQNADLIKNAIENDDIKKLTVTGKMKDAKPYENKKGETIQYQELIVDTLNRHKTVEINGVIAKVEDKKTSNDKPYTHLFIKNNVNVGGVEKVEQFNVTIFQENKKGIPADVELKVGQPIAIKGEATITRYLDKENNIKESTNINAWNADRTPTRLREQIKDLQDKAATQEKEPVKSEAPKNEKTTKKTASTKKGKDSGMQM